MYISNDRNTINKEQPKMPPASKQGQFGSMNPNLYTVLIILGILQILLIGYLIIPRVVSLYYQTRGGQVVDRVLSRGQKTQWDSIACANPPVTSESSRDILLKAEEDLIKAMRISPGESHPKILLGRTYCLLGEPGNAIDSYQEYIDLRPANPLGNLELGFAYEAACHAEQYANQDKSKLRIEQQRCNLPQYQELMISAWKSAGLTTQDFIDTGVSALEHDRHVDALAWFRRASELSPDSGAPWFYIGKVYATRERLNISIEAYLTSLNMGYSGSTDALMEIYTINGDEEGVIDLLRQALDRFSGHPERKSWWSQLGEVYRKQKKWEEAILVFEEAISDLPDSPDLHIYLGQFYYEGRGDIGKATEEIKQAIALDPESGSGYYALARILVKEKRYSEADDWFDRALERNPEANLWQLARANAARDGGNLLLAQQEYLAIIERTPSFPSAYYEIALLYRLKEQPAEAVGAIERAIEMMKNPNQDYYMRAASIYEWIGDQDKAVEAYRIALDLNPNNRRASERIEQLTGKDGD